MPEKLPKRRHKILKAMLFMASGVADDETRFDRCGASGSSNSRPLVGESKEPVILYHGTKDTIEEGFDLDPPNRKDNGWLGRLRRIN